MNHGGSGGGTTLEASDTQGIHYNRPPTNHQPLVDGRKHLHHSVVKLRREVWSSLKCPYADVPWLMPPNNSNNREIVITDWNIHKRLFLVHKFDIGCKRYGRNSITQEGFLLLVNGIHINYEPPINNILQGKRFIVLSASINLYTCCSSVSQSLIICFILFSVLVWH